MSARRGNLTVEGTGKDLAITSSHVCVRLALRDGGYCQEFLAADRKDGFQLLLSSVHKNLIPWSEHRSPAAPMISGDRAHLFGVSRDALRMVYSSAEIIHHDEQRVTALLTGSVQNHNLRCKITVFEGSNAVHVEVEDNIDRQGCEPLVEFLMSSYAFLPAGRMLPMGAELDYLWAPALRPAADHVIGDAAFHSPAVVVQQSRLAAALIPDLGVLADNRTMPVSLDLDLSNGLLPAPLLSYGFCGYETLPEGHHRHDMTMARRLSEPRLVYAYHLLLSADCDRKSAHSMAARFLWDRYGGSSSKPARQMHRPESTARLRPDARSAFGLYASALHDGSEHGQRVARGLKQEILAAPQDRGLFPTRFSVQRDEWDGCNFGAAAAYYHTAECSEQLYWLLKWYQSFEKDKSILRYARRYADFLIEARLRTGEIPSWYALDHHPLYPLRSGTQTAASAMFLAEMGRATGHAKYINAAERSARFVLKELTSGSAYQDCTLMSRTGGFRLECKDPHTRQCPQSAQAMLWVARLCLDLHLAGAGSAYLSQGLGALDHLCMLQAVWSKPWNDWEEAGLLAASNVGVTYDAELTAEFARCAMDYGIATGEREYCQRAAAALSSAEAAAGRDQVRQSKVAASRMLVEGTHGTAYVHVGRKWAVSTNGWSIENLDFGRGIIKMTISGKAEESDRLVFGGMRAANYRISINGRVRTHTREELEAGITLSMRQPPLPLL